MARKYPNKDEANKRLAKSIDKDGGIWLVSLRIAMYKQLSPRIPELKIGDFELSLCVDDGCIVCGMRLKWQPPYETEIAFADGLTTSSLNTVLGAFVSRVLWEHKSRTPATG